MLGHNAAVVDGQHWSVMGDVSFVAPRRVDNILRVPPSPVDQRAVLGHVLKLLR